MCDGDKGRRKTVQEKTVHVHLWPVGPACYEAGCLAVMFVCVTAVILAVMDKLPW